MNGQVPYPDNPNGSTANVAGICDSTGRIFGLMPHPERHMIGRNILAGPGRAWLKKEMGWRSSRTRFGSSRDLFFLSGESRLVKR